MTIAVITRTGCGYALRFIWREGARWFVGPPVEEPLSDLVRLARDVLSAPAEDSRELSN